MFRHILTNFLHRISLYTAGRQGMVDISLSALGAIEVWNLLPPEIKRKQSTASFESALRKHFLWELRGTLILLV